MAIKRYRNVDMNKNEIQNAKGHILPSAPNDAAEAQVWYNSTSKRFQYNDGTQNKDIGKEYTEGQGIDITGETISIDTDVVPLKTDLPTVGNAEIEIQKNGVKVDSFTANQSGDKKVINIPIPTSASDVNALPTSTKYGAIIDVTLSTTDYKQTITLKDQSGNTLSTKTVDFPVESMVVSGSYDNTNKKIVLALQNGTTTDIPVADLVKGLQTEITSTNKLSSDLVDDTNKTHKFATQAQLDQIATNTTNIATINSTLSGHGDIVTHNANEFASTYEVCQRVFAINPALTTSGGQVVWNIDNNFASLYLSVNVYERSGSTYIDVTSGVEVSVTETSVTIKMNSASNIAEGAYTAVIFGRNNNTDDWGYDW